MERQAAAKVQKTSTRISHTQTQSGRSPAAAHSLLDLQRSIGNQAVQRLIRSPFIQAKLQISKPGDPFEQEADRVADTVMRMPEVEAAQEETPEVQAKPLATQITPLVQREPEQPLEEEPVATKPDLQRVPLAVREDDDEEKVAREVDTNLGEEEEKITAAVQREVEQPIEEKEEAVAGKPVVQRVPLAVREDDDEEKVAPKLETSPIPQDGEKENAAEPKLVSDTPIQRQTREDEDKKIETLQTAPPIQRQMEDEEHEEVLQTKLFASESSQLPGISPVSVTSSGLSIQRLCAGCEVEQSETRRLDKRSMMIDRSTQLQRNYESGAAPNLSPSVSEGAPQIQTKPLATQITPLVQRESKEPVEEKKEEAVPNTVVQRAPLAVREDEDEEKIAPKLETDPEPQGDVQEKEAQAKPEVGTDIQRQTKGDEEKKEETLQTAPPIQRQMEDEDEKADASIQRLCTYCEGEGQQDTRRREEMVQRKFAPAQLRDEDELEKQQVRPRRADSVAPSVTTPLAANIRRLQGGGSPLPPATRAFFEPRFGVDFSQVRVHTSAQAEEAAKSINAKAFTVGRNIAFGKGQYRSESQEGSVLLAHELTHVVQQSSAELYGHQSTGDRGVSQQKRTIASDPIAQRQPQILQLPASSPLTVRRSIVPGFLRSDKGTKEEIEAAIKSEDPADIKAIDDFSQAIPPQKARLVQILLNKTNLWLFDKRAMARIWNSFGDFETLNEDQVSLLRTCVNRGFSPTDLKGYPFLAGDFRDSVKREVQENLMQNATLIQKEADRLGLTGDKPKEGEKYNAEIQKLQELASLIKDAKLMLARARKIVVAHTGELEHLRTGKGPALGGQPITFDPENQPEAPSATPVTEVNRARGEMPWGAVYPAYASFSQTIASILAQNPALYALQILGEPMGVSGPTKPGQAAPLVYGEQSRLSGFEMMGPKQAREKVGKALLDVYNNARKTLGNVMSGKMSPLQFDLVVDQHKKGQHGQKWGKPYTKFIAERMVAEDRPAFDEAMEMVGIMLLLGAVAIGTGGAATPVLGAILAGANVATAAAAAAYKTFEAGNVQQAAHSAASAKTAVTSQQQADRAALDAQMYQFMAIASVAGEVLGALLPAARAGMNLGAVDLLPATERATAIVEALESMEVGQVALRTGKKPEDLAEIIAARAVADPKAKSALDKIREFMSRLAPGAKELEVSVMISGEAHALQVRRVGNRVELWLCTHCARIIEKIDEVLAKITPTGDTKSLHARLTRQRQSAVELELKINSGEVPVRIDPKKGTQHAIGEMNQIAANLRDLSEKFPEVQGLLAFQTFKPSRSMLDYDQLAQRHGFVRTNLRSHGQPVYQLGANDFITPDVDAHIGGVWKRATSYANLGRPQTRLGTYDENLKRIGP